MDQAHRRKATGRETRREKRWVGLLASVLFAVQSSTGPWAEIPKSASPASLKGVTFENSVLRIRLDRPVRYRVFSLEKPNRLVIELSDTFHGDKPYTATLKDDVLKKIRFAQFQTAPEKIARVVLEVAHPVPFRASQEGSDLVFTFGERAKSQTEAAVAPPAKKPAVEAKAVPAATPGSEEGGRLEGGKAPVGEVLTGEAEETVESSAIERTVSAGGGRLRRSKDLLGSLPKSPVTIDFDDADIGDVLRVLSEMSGVNIIHAANVRGTVSVHLDQVPFNEAFETILTMQGLVAQQMGSNILRILTPEDLNSDRARAVVTYKTFTLNYAKASEIQPLLGSVKISPGSRTEVNERNNSLIVTDTPEGISAAERLISELDVRPQQVLIEAKIVEVSLNKSMSLGIQWEYSARSMTSGGTANTMGLRTVTTGAVATGLASPGFTGTQLNPVSGTLEQIVTRSATPGERGTGVQLPNSSPNSSAFTFGFINNTDLLTATINALATEGKTKVLSAPRVITLNNKEAKIQVGSKLPFSTVTIAQSGVSTQSITFVDVGIMLQVTPVINADNRVRLHVKPEVSLPGQITSAGPQIDTRNADTEVIIRDGETLVIGGLIDEQTRQSVSKVPILGDIPVLGMFFRSSIDQKNRTELLIFLTPRIVRD
jgi:type IV pilus secretin PilQ/predicted competence protein